MKKTSQREAWFAMRVYMNKVSVCRDLFNQCNRVLQGLIPKTDEFPEEMQGDVMEYYAPFYLDTYINTKGKRVDVQKPLIPSLFFMHSSERQAECLEKLLTGRAHLYRQHKGYQVTPIQIPLKQMQMFMMVSSGDQEGLDYFEADAFNWQKGERVRVIDGRFKGLEGEIKRIQGDHRLVVTLDGICAVATTYIPRCFLEKID